VDPATYAETVVAVLEERALHADRVAWPAARRRLADLARHAQEPADLHPALREVVQLAGGRHSGLRGPADVRAAAARTRTAPVPTVRSVAGVPVLVLPGLGGDRAATRRYVRAGRAALARAGGHRSGWVVDLRSNPGGNMWPMLRVLAPLLGPGPVGAFVLPGGAARPWRVPWTARRPWHRPPARIAVLHGPATASSGEAAAIALLGVPGVRSFGAATAGFTTANESFALPDGALLHLSTCRMADRSGRVADGPLVPDVAAAEPLAPALRHAAGRT
jgi:carboxyl-terminal processing protease